MMTPHATARRLISFLVLDATLGLPAATYASDTCDAEQALELFTRARTAEDKNDMAAACEDYAASMAACQRPSTAIKLAYCRQHEGKFVAAWMALQHARELNNREPDTYRRDLEAEIQEALRAVPTLQIVLDTWPEELVVNLDGTPIPSEQLRQFIPIEPGEHVLSASAPGHDPLTTSFHGQKRRLVVVRLELTPSGPPAARVEPEPTSSPRQAPVAATTAPSAAARDRFWSEQRTVGAVVGGVGLLGFCAAGMLGLLTLARVSDSDKYCQYPDGSCDPRGVELRHQASDLQTAGFVVVGASAAVLATGAVVWFTAPDAGSHPQTTGRAAGGAATPWGWHLAARGTW